MYAYVSTYLQTRNKRYLMSSFQLYKVMCNVIIICVSHHTYTCLPTSLYASTPDLLNIFQLNLVLRFTLKVVGQI
jgi:hypothetical protein